MYYAIVFVVGILLGGFGGYKWGQSVERKAASFLGTAGGAIGQAAKKL
jgi:hypothetical protein